MTAQDHFDKHAVKGSIIHAYKKEVCELMESFARERVRAALDYASGCIEFATLEELEEAFNQYMNQR
jgi:nickel-dependent lactate racemase